MIRYQHPELNCGELHCAADRARPRLRAVERHGPRRTFSAWLDRLRARTDLRQLDERMLRDIGVTPDWLERESTKPFWEA
jgi:uncharacterized protein YjiS (DUF1127 family)